MLRLLAAFLLGTWVARALGPEEYGLLRYAISISGIFTAICSMGIDSLLAVDLVKYKRAEPLLMGTGLLLKLAMTASVLIGLLICLIVFNEDIQRIYIIIIVASSAIFQSISVIDVYFIAKLKSKIIATASISSVVLGSLIKLYFLVIGANVYVFATLIMIDSLIMAIMSCAAYKISGKKFTNWRYNSLVAKSFIFRSKSLMIGLFAAGIYTKIDQVMLGYILDTASVGIYSVAVSFAELWTFVAIGVTQTATTPISKAKRNRNRYIHLLQRQYDILAKISFIIAVINCAFAHMFIGFVYGKQYDDSILVLQILSWTVVFAFMSNGSWAYYINENLLKYASARLVSGAALNVLLNVFLIPRFEIVGAAVAALISYSFSAFFFNVIFAKTRINFYLQLRSLSNVFRLSTWKIGYFKL